MDGFLNIAKPAGVTSRDVVNQLQRLVRPAKIGHAGTLDPLATGVLVVCVGQGTRLTEYVQLHPKSYRATFLFGRTSDTDDTDGDVTELPDRPALPQDDIARALLAFVGDIWQRPPDYSAVKLQGRRAYDLARRGEKPDLQPRQVRVDAIRLLAWRSPELVLEIDCGSGTYIRSIGRDLATSLGTGAVMSSLVRTAIGPFQLEQAVSPAGLGPESLAQHLLPLGAAVGALPRMQITPEEAERLRRGQFLSRPQHGLQSATAAFLADHELVAITRPHDEHQLRPEKVFHLRQEAAE